MLSVTTYAVQLQSISNIQRNQTAFDLLSQQVSSGIKSSDLSTYGGLDAQRIIDSHQEVTRREAYNKSIDIVTPRLKSYDLQLGRMDDLAKATAASLNLQDSFDPADLAALSTQIDNTLRDLTTLLNDRIDNRFLWSGQNYGSAPVRDLTTLPDLAAPTPFAAAGDPATGDYTLPDYHTGAPGTDQASWSKDVFSPEPGKTVQYTQVANDPSIQRLIHSLQLAKSSIAAAQAAPDAAAAETAFDSFREQAIAELTTSRDEMRQLRSAVAIDLKSITESRTTNVAAIAMFKDEEGKIVQIDPAEASVKLSRVQTQLEATYKITAALTQTSLVKYL